MTRPGEIAAISAPLPWQARAWTHLSTQVVDDSLPHALLLSGGQYSGKSRFALALSRLLLCSQPRQGLNCGDCPACLLSAGGSHGDFRWVAPEGDSRVIKVDQVRAMIGFVQQTAGYGSRKVVVLAPADSMNRNAYNALLKSLEEPAPGTYLILVCHSLHNVPATVLSRCRLQPLPVPSLADSLDWLDGYTGDRQASERLMALAPNRPLLASELFLGDGGESVALRRGAMTAVARGQVSPVQAAAAWDEAPLADFLDEVHALVQEQIRAMTPQRLQSGAGRRAFLLLDEIMRLQRAVAAGANPARKLAAETLLARVKRDLGAAAVGDSI